MPGTVVNDSIKYKLQTFIMNSIFDHGSNLEKEDIWELAKLLSFTCIMVFILKVKLVNNIASVLIYILSGNTRNYCHSYCGQ